MFSINNYGVCIIISELEHKIIKLTCCKWCGSEFLKEHNRQVYCSEYCSKEARKEKNNEYFRKYYHKYKNVMDEEERCGLGSGFLGMHRHEDFNMELLAIKKEKAKIGL